MPQDSSPRSAATTDTTLALLERWRAGDRRALDQLLSDVQPWLHHEMRKALGGRPRDLQDSLDLAQTAVLNFLTWGPKFVPENSTQFRSLLKRIATNELIDQERRRARGARGQHLESLAGTSSRLSGFGAAAASSLRPSRGAEREEEIEWVRLALQFLEPDDRYALLASEVEGLDWTTIAVELGLESPDSARMRCVRLKPRVARLLLDLRKGRVPPD